VGKVQIKQLGRCSGPLGGHQMTVLEIIIPVLYRFVRLCNRCCEFDVCQWATHDITARPRNKKRH